MTAAPRRPECRTVHVLEPTILGPFGHHFEFAKRAAAAFEARGWGHVLHVSAHADADRLLDDADVLLRPTFGFRYQAAFALSNAMTPGVGDHPAVKVAAAARRRLLRPSGSTAWENRGFALAEHVARLGRRFGHPSIDEVVADQALRDVDDLLDFIVASGGRGRDALHLPTTERYILEALARRAARVAAAGLTIHARCWCLESLESPGVDLRPIIASAHQALTTAGAQVRWYAETEAARADITRLTGRQAELQTSLAFTPKAAFPSRRPPLDRAPAGPRVIDVLAPGGVRRFPDKGMGFLVRVAQAMRLAGGMRLRLQRPPTDLFPKERRALEDSGCVTFLEPTLNSATYVEELRSASAVILAYDDVTWLDRSRGSGVVFDALAMGVPFFMKSGLPIERSVTDYKVERIDSAQCLVEKLTALTNLDYELSFLENRRKFWKSHENDSMLSHLSS